MNSALTEQKIKLNVDGEVVLHSQQQTKRFTELYRTEQSEEGDGAF